eukprot:PhM_4_TR3894/c0_g1_i1/m.77368/K16185/RRAGA_B; Ras-related GTP-binding protein A/B
MKKKVLLMGRSASGKTSMRSIIFANYLARDAKRLGPTIDMEQSQVKILGSLVLNLWDCGGQEQFMENYLRHQRDHIFGGVAVLIYVFDVESRTIENDMQKFRTCVESLSTYSPNAQLFCLVHKMDLVSENQRGTVFGGRQHSINELLSSIAAPMQAQCFATSIWDESLYHAWSSIVHAMIPNVEVLEKNLIEFGRVCEAEEVVLFERATFLVISRLSNRPNSDAHRFEKISNIMKQFKLSCTKAGTSFTSMAVSSSDFSAFIEKFTENTYVLFVISDKMITPAATRINIAASRKKFDEAMSKEDVKSTGLLL